MRTLLLLLALLPGLALAAPIPDDANADVVATRDIAAPPEAIYALLLDLGKLKEISDEGCVGRWVFGEKVQGVGATAGLRYHAGGMHRRLQMTLTKAEENKKITLDHAGNRGFISTWTLTPTDAGTRVEFHTWLSIPPWPFRKYYFNKVQPAWVACQDKALQNLADATEPP